MFSGIMRFRNVNPRYHVVSGAILGEPSDPAFDVFAETAGNNDASDDPTMEVRIISDPLDDPTRLRVLGKSINSLTD